VRADDMHMCRILLLFGGLKTRTSVVVVIDVSLFQFKKQLLKRVIGEGHVLVICCCFWSISKAAVLEAKQ
jgi:hypothetical protein